MIGLALRAGLAESPGEREEEEESRGSETSSGILRESQ